MSTWNKDWMIVSGTFTGTVETVYEINFLNNDGIKWRTKQDGEWSSNTVVANSNWSLDTAISLAYGLSITFTRGDKSNYNTGDSWSFTMYQSIQLTPYTDTDYDTLEIIERSDKRDLVVISSSSGIVSVIEDFEGTPNLINGIANIGAIETIDTCNRNKEIYVAAGDKSPRFLGYTKNKGFEGTDEDFKFIEDMAYEQLDSESFNAKAMNDFVFLRGDASTQGAGRIAVGIIYGERELYVWNIADLKLYTFTLGAPAIRIRPDTSVFTTVNNETVCNGVAILTEPQELSHCNALECWSIPFDTNDVGQGANLDRTISIYGPPNNEVIGPSDSGKGSGFSDFLIISQYNDVPSQGGFFTIVLAPKLSGTEDISVACLFKVDDFDTINTFTDYSNITPDLDYTQQGLGNYNVFMSRREDINFEWTGFCENEDNVPPDIGTKTELSRRYDDWETIRAHIDKIQDISLAFAGYDANGENPMFHFTARIKAWEHFVESGDVDQWYTDYSGNDPEVTGQNFPNQHIYRDYGPFWLDKDGYSIGVSWVTFIMNSSSEGTVKAPKLLHLQDWDNPNAFKQYYELSDNRYNPTDAVCKRLVDNKHCIASWRPTFSINQSLGLKYMMIGDKNTNGLRWGMTVPKPGVTDGYSKVYTFKTPFSADAGFMWQGFGIFVFPNSWSDLYDRLVGEMLTSSLLPESVTSRLGSDNTDDSKRWALGDTDYAMEIATAQGSNGFPVQSHSHLLMAARREGFEGYIGRISDIKMDADYTDIETNMLGNSSGWIELSTPVVNAQVDWEGQITKKSFYRVSLVYDGYQESTLLSIQSSFAQSGDGFTKGLKLVITIDSEWIPPDRVASIVVYRADDPLHTVQNPAGLYRFVEEIPLLKFNINSSSGDYTYTVYDSGVSQGSYGAINGISETLSNLYIKYTVCASLNGYMFVGNCNHTKFDSAENYIFRSQPGKYSIFDWSKDFTPVDFVPKAMVGFMGKLYVFGVNKLAIINPETLVVEDDISGIGCIGPKAIQVSPSGLFWFDQNNIYTANPQIRKIGTTILKQDSFGWSILPNSVKSSAVSGYDSNRHCFLIYFTKSSDNRVWSYYIPTNRWDLWETDYLVYDTVQSSDGYSILLMENGRISKHLGGTNKRDWEFESKKLSFGVDTVKKKVKVIKADATSRDVTGLTYKTNENYSSWQSGDDNSNKYFATGVGKAIKIASSDAKLRWLKVRVTGDNAQYGSDVKTKVIGIVYKPKSPK